MSAPAVNAFSPETVRTIVRVSSCLSRSARARTNSAFSIIDIALSLSGRFNATTAVGPRRVTKIVSYFMGIGVGTSPGGLRPRPSLTLIEVDSAIGTPAGSRSDSAVQDMHGGLEAHALPA